MNFTPESLQFLEDNSRFLGQFIFAVGRNVRGLSSLRILDYGSGSRGLDLWRAFFPKINALVGFDPMVDAREEAPLAFIPRHSYVNLEPSADYQFNLVVLSFSLHHLDNPEAVIQKIKASYHPRIMAVADYDFTRASMTEFQRAFVAETEQRELEQLFGNDMEACYRFHSRYGAEEVQEIMTGQNIQVVENRRGRGVAKYKYFVIGQI